MCLYFLLQPRDQQASLVFDAYSSFVLFDLQLLIFLRVYIYIYNNIMDTNGFVDLT